MNQTAWKIASQFLAWTFYLGQNHVISKHTDLE